MEVKHESTCGSIAWSRAQSGRCREAAFNVWETGRRPTVAGNVSDRCRARENRRPRRYRKHPRWAYRDPTTHALEPVYSVHYNDYAARLQGADGL
jgi:hypothetical protein